MKRTGEETPPPRGGGRARHRAVPAWRALVVAGAGLALGCGGSTNLPDPPGGVDVATVQLGDLDRALYPTLTDTVLSEPSDFVLAGDRIWVAETRASVVTVLSTQFDFVRRIGSRGKGPGELTDPFTVRAYDAVVSVGDRGTGRFELFDTVGESLGSYPLRAGHEHALLGTDRLVAVDRDSSTFGTLIGPEGARPFGSAPSGEGGSRSPVPFTEIHRAALDGEGVLLLVPQTTGTLHIHDMEGELVESRELPPVVLAELEEDQRKTAEMFGGAVVGSSLVKGVGVSQDGRYVTFATMSETAPVLIHDLDGRRILYVNTTGHRLAGRVENARIATYDGGLLYLLSDASLFAFELTLPD